MEPQDLQQTSNSYNINVKTIDDFRKYFNSHMKQEMDIFEQHMNYMNIIGNVFNFIYLALTLIFCIFAISRYVNYSADILFISFIICFLSIHIE